MAIKPMTLSESIRINVLQVVSDKTGIPVEDILSRSRKHEILTARQTVAYVFNRIFKLPLKTTGQYIGGFDHSTICNSVNIIDDYLFLKNSYEYNLIKDILDHFTIDEAKKSA